jgi:hypothetical protein
MGVAFNGNEIQVGARFAVGDVGAVDGTKAVVLVESANEAVIGHLADRQKLWIPWNRNARLAP